MSWETVIGLEIHVQLDTESKCFCACARRFGDPPNTNVCAVCFGLPGALPVLNERALDLAVRTAVALECAVPDASVFARKNYFYPDLPKGYQISQYEHPLGVGGRIPFECDGEVRHLPLVRVHLEEDAGKSLHDEGGGGGDTRLDLNRCGTPLLEIVSEPSLRRPEEAGAVLESLRRTVRWIGVSDGEMSRGNLRCDANVSVRRAGGTDLGTKTELKNLNSIRMVERAIAREAARQVQVLERGGSVEAATMLWDDAAGEVRRMRSKEDAPDYRYFPEPDLPVVRVDAARRAAARAALPEPPLARRERFRREHGLSDADAARLTESRDLADYFEALAAAAGDARLACHWVTGEVLRLLGEGAATLTDPGMPASDTGELLRLVREGSISPTAAKAVFATMRATGRKPREIVASDGLAQLSDDATLEALAGDVIAKHPAQAGQVRAGEEKVLGFLVGQAMKASGGRANPGRLRAILAARLMGGGR